MLLFVWISISFAQIDWKNYSQIFPDSTYSNPKAVAILTLINHENDSFDDNIAGSISSFLSRDTSFTKVRPKGFVTAYAFDTLKAQFFLHGINAINASAYQYRRTIYNGLKQPEWQNIDPKTGNLFTPIPGWPAMYYLGGYKASLGDLVVIDVREKSTGRIVSTAVVYYQAVKPQLFDIFMPDELNDFLTLLHHTDGYHVSLAQVNKWKDRYSVKSLDPYTMLPFKLKLRHDQNNLIFFLKADIKSRNLLEYELLCNGQTVKVWQANDFDNGFIWLKNLQPGAYTLKYRFSVQKQNDSAYSFIIMPAWYQTTLFKFCIVILTLILTGLIIWIIRLLGQRKKSEKELLRREVFRAELQSIRAQLNPHFVFNALNSIQNLYDENKSKADKYLVEFAQLLRNTLTWSKKEKTPIVEEKKILETYLNLEQLRFEFKYTIQIDRLINIYETEIPSLLLQPLVENAIKHGIAHLGSKGSILINLDLLDKDILITITDNGKGFSQETETGFGIQLTKDRIAMINKIQPESPIVMDIESQTGNGSIVRITLKNWLYEY